MKIFGQKESNYLYKTRVTFENINKNPAIVTELEKVSYDAVRIQVGMDLHSQTENLFRLVVEKRQSRLALTQKIKQQFKDVYQEHIGHVQRLRKELVNSPALLEELDLVGRRKTTISGFIEQATHFFNKAISDAVLAAAIQPAGFTAQMLVDSQARLQQYQTDRSNYEKSGGELQKLVVEKNKAFKSLRAWIAALTAAARVAFADNLQTLEEIGFFIRNKPNPKKKSDTTPVDTTTPPVTPPTEPTEPPEPVEPVIAA